jgi:MoaA/NifB/PqqE/SkfB family radical SAM enzyme
MEIRQEVEHLIEESKRLVERGLHRLGDKADPAELKEIDFELTYLCNERCVMCDIWNKYRVNPIAKEKELTIEEIATFFERSNYLKGIERIVLSGGEPFLRKDFVDLCGYFIKRYPNLSLGILTNLFDTEFTMRKIESVLTQYNPQDFWLGSSLDGIGQNHDSIRRTKGAFDALIRSIDLIKKEFPRIGICLNFTLTPRNYKDILSAFEFARKKNISFSAQFAVPWEGAEKFFWNEKEIKEVNSYIQQIMERMVKDYHRVRFADRLIGNIYHRYLLSHLYYWDGLVLYQLKPHRFFKRCIAGARFATFSPEGGLYFCPIFKNRLVGNIRDYGYEFDKLWMSEEADRQRELINDGQCHCWLNCTIYPNIQEAIGFMQSPWERKIVSVGRFIKERL